MHSEQTRQAGGYRKTQHMNTVIDGYPVLATTHFVCGEPRWAGIVRRGFFLLSGGGLAYLWTTAPHFSLIFTLLLWIFSGLMIFAALRPVPVSIHYASDQQGVYFPARQRLKILGPVTAQSWLFVPWSNIFSVCVQPLLTESENAMGVTFRLPASAAEQQVYFDGTAMLTCDEEVHLNYCGHILVGFPSGFKSPHEVVALLSSFRNQQSSIPDRLTPQTSY